MYAGTEVLFEVESCVVLGVWCIGEGTPLAQTVYRRVPAVVSLHFLREDPGTTIPKHTAFTKWLQETPSLFYLWGIIICSRVR